MLLLVQALSGGGQSGNLGKQQRHPRLPLLVATSRKVGPMPCLPVPQRLLTVQQPITAVSVSQVGSSWSHHHSLHLHHLNGWAIFTVVQLLPTLSFCPKVQLCIPSRP